VPAQSGIPLDSKQTVDDTDVASERIRGAFKMLRYPLVPGLARPHEVRSAIVNSPGN